MYIQILLNMSFVLLRFHIFVTIHKLICLKLYKSFLYKLIKVANTGKSVIKLLGTIVNITILRLNNCFVIFDIVNR